MNDNKKQIRKMVILANLIAVAIVLGLIETQLAIISVPGAKLGLANLITITVLYVYGFKEAAVVSILRIFLVSLLSGSFGPTFFMGLGGGVLSLLAMGLLKNVKLGITLVSLLGSIAHQIGQIIVGIYVIGSQDVVYYLVIMIPLGIITGIINGFIAEKFITGLKNKKQIE